MSVNGINKWLFVFLLVCVSQNLVAQTSGEDKPFDNEDEVVSEHNTEAGTGIKNRFWQSWRRIAEVFERALNREVSENRDPWESWNRKAFAFNETADKWVLTPIARGYQWITPDPVETGIGNVFSNLLDINVIVNDLLQFKLKQAASDSGRFLVNTTVGVGGVFDVASSLGLEKHDEDFGQTLGKWGLSSGPYVVVPLLGSYTLRSATGAIGDSTVDVIGHIPDADTRLQVWALRQVHNRAELFAAESLITGDRYTFVRDAYLQYRDFLVNDGVPEDDFGDEDFNGWEDADEQWMGDE